MASRPDLVPKEWVDELSKLQDQAQPLPFTTIKTVIENELGGAFDKYFLSLDEAPLGAASIGQVHRAVLLSGESVVVKVQRPGIVEIINDDLSVLYFLAELLETYVEEAKLYNPVGIVDEFCRALEQETSFVIEANNLQRFQHNFKNDPTIRIPKVNLALTTPRVLVMEYFNGLPLTNPNALKGEGVSPGEIVRLGLRAYLKMVFEFGLFHGDLHAGNFMIMPDNTIGLIDFGLVGRLNRRTQNAVVNMLLALAEEDYEKLANEYVEISPFNDNVSVDLFSKDLRDLIAPHYGLTLRNVNIGKILMGSAEMAAKHSLVLPSELILFFKSLVAIDGLGRKITPDFDFLTCALEFSGELVKNRLQTDKIAGDLKEVLKDSGNLIQTLPRQLKYLLRRWNSPGHAIRVKIEGIEKINKTFENSYYVKFLAIVISSLLLCATLIFITEKGPIVWGVPGYALGGYFLSGILSFFAFIKFFLGRT